MTAPAVPLGSRTQFSNGPWKSVRNTPEPFNNSPDQLVAATNVYIPDPDNGSGVYARWGYVAANSATALATDRGQCVHTHIDSTGTLYNFVVCGAKLYRASSGPVGAYTDVTPVNVTFNGTGRVYMLSFNGSLIVNGGPEPFIVTDYASTPVTATFIDIDGLGTAWVARGQPVEYGGSVIFILAEYNSVLFPTDIVWSAPGDPTTGYIQTVYDFRWTLSSSDSEAMQALCANDLGLYYFRAHSIGVLTGTPATANSSDGSDFRNASTTDSIAQDIGCTTPATVQQYGSNIFFVDAVGRPWMLPVGPWQQQVGTNLVPLWEQMQTILNGLTTEQGSIPNFIANSAHACIFPVLGLYVVGIMDTATSTKLPTSLAVFNARTGTYQGQWTINGGITIAAMGILTNASTNEQFHVVLGSLAASTSQDPNYVWSTDEVWWDFNGTADMMPGASVTTPRFGFDASTVQNVDKLTAITGTIQPVALTVSTPIISQSVTSTPLASTDGTYRAIASVDVMGRGVTVSATPDYTVSGAVAAQWSLQRVVAEGVSSMAGVDDA